MGEQTETKAPQTVPSTSDARVANNVMRHNYRVLSEPEKAQMQELKDKGLEFVELLYRIGGDNGTVMPADGTAQSSRELALSQVKIEEAVMWAVKHITR